MEDSVFQNSPVNPSGYQSYQKSSKKGKRFLFVAVGLLIVLALVFFGAKSFIGSKGTQKIEPTSTPTPTEELFPTETPTPTVAVSPTTVKPTPTKIPTPKPTFNPVDKETGLDRSGLSVEVKNGSGEAGVGSKMSETLKEFGYRVVSVGNADNYSYENTVIEVKSDKDKYLPLLKKDLSINYKIGSLSANLSASSSADAVVIVGK